MYGSLLGDIKTRIRQGQVRATLTVNSELISMYWDVGMMIRHRQAKEGWSAAVIPRLSKDIRNELPEVKGFSKRNLGYMLRFAKEYEEFLVSEEVGIIDLQQAVAKNAKR